MNHSWKLEHTTSDSAFKYKYYLCTNCNLIKSNTYQGSKIVYGKYILPKNGNQIWRKQKEFSHA